ncbi:hypothetical protein K438DRAFT_1747367 [Mycena galopus ATCC 62051]|nr:hypothetical protein K438DRAFT_1747367 [Mycena galopus ATCC 62051]
MVLEGIATLLLQKLSQAPVNKLAEPLRHCAKGSMQNTKQAVEKLYQAGHGCVLTVLESWEYIKRLLCPAGLNEGYNFILLVDFHFWSWGSGGRWSLIVRVEEKVRVKRREKKRHVQTTLVQTGPNANKGGNIPDQAIKDYLVGPMESNPVVHGWSTDSRLFNHLDENIAKVMNKPMIITHDCPSDCAAGADAIADALDELKLANKEDFIIIPPTPKQATRDKVTKDPSKAIIHTTRKDSSDRFTFYLIPAFPEPSWYIGALSDPITRMEFISALFEKLITDHTVINMILNNHGCVPDAHNIPLVVCVLLEHTQIKACKVQNILPISVLC